MKKETFNYKGIILTTEESPNYSCNGCYFMEEDKTFRCSDKNLKESGLRLCTDPKPGIIFVKGDIEIADINFIKWYSGMDEQKIRRAYERYLRENPKATK